jgi:hypothetical protein
MSHSGGKASDRWGRERPRGRGGCCSPVSRGGGYPQGRGDCCTCARVAAAVGCRGGAATPPTRKGKRRSQPLGEPSSERHRPQGRGQVGASPGLDVTGQRRGATVGKGAARGSQRSRVGSALVEQGRWTSRRGGWRRRLTQRRRGQGPPQCGRGSGGRGRAMAVARRASAWRERTDGWADGADRRCVCSTGVDPTGLRRRPGELAAAEDPVPAPVAVAPTPWAATGRGRGPARRPATAEVEGGEGAATGEGEGLPREGRLNLPDDNGRRRARRPATRRKGERWLCWGQQPSEWREGRGDRQ